MFKRLLGKYKAWIILAVIVTSVVIFGHLEYLDAYEYCIQHHLKAECDIRL